MKKKGGTQIYLRRPGKGKGKSVVSGGRRRGSTKSIRRGVGLKRASKGENKKKKKKKKGGP